MRRNQTLCRTGNVVSTCGCALADDYLLETAVLYPSGDIRIVGRWKNLLEAKTQHEVAVFNNGGEASLWRKLLLGPWR